MEKNETNPSNEKEPVIKETATESTSEAPPKSEREELLAEIASWQDQYKKALLTAAHHENLSKVYKGDFERLSKYRSQPLIERLLPTIDSFQMAFSMPSTPEVENYRMGFDFIYKLLLSVLEAEGVNEIMPKVGEPYDLAIHHAIEVVETNDPKKDQTIASVILSGYRYKDRVLRASNVRLFQLKKESNQEQKNENKETAKEPEAVNH